jgi:uncharacterized protein (TIGR00251 family)
VAPFDVDGDGHVVLPVHVQPGARRAGVAGRHGDALKLRVSAPPERGKANEAVCALIADELDARSGDVDVVAGHTSRAKRVVVRNVAPATVERWLAKHGLT